jgi:site-specific DNA recombinase
MNVAIYLRKSRSDIEAETIGEFETLARHRAILLEYAKKNNLNIREIKEEIVSGESIVTRPKMIELLQEVEENKYDAVLVMDIDRLGRGNMKEQGVILETFKDSKTKIMTPQKIYNLDDELDEQMTEMQTFIARQELKMSKKRMLRGRMKSVEEGNYLGARAPYGYEILNKGKRDRTLKINDEQAEVVKMIFDLYINEDMGTKKIAYYLNSLGIKAYFGDIWTYSSINNIISNRVYTGYIEWQKNLVTKKMNENGNYILAKNNSEDIVIAKGKHEAIISEEIFDKAHKIKKSKSRNMHIGGKSLIQNPLVGLIKCEACGKTMTKNHAPRGEATMICRGCNKNKGSYLKYVEKAILDALRDALREYEVKSKKIVIKEDKEFDYNRMIKNLENELEELKKQNINLYNLLERGIYDDKTFLDRSEYISKRSDEIKDSIKKLEGIKSQPKNLDDSTMASRLRTVLEMYNNTDSAIEKNKLLKSIIKDAYYFKRSDQRNNEFQLTVDLYLNEY